MNLINDRWIPIRRADRSKDKIAPWEITENIHDKKKKIIAVASPRPDFDGALTQFLIGLLQTACTPETEDAWWDWRQSPPNPDYLLKCFEQVAHAFIFEGEGPKFMQDFNPEKLGKETRKIENILIGGPGKNTIEDNIDHFVKRDTVNFLCSHCATTALYTLQLNASGGGSGYRTGIRGGGPLSTLVLGKTLWETCWLNVLVRSNYLKKILQKLKMPTASLGLLQHALAKRIRGAQPIRRMYILTSSFGPCLAESV